ncbi:hypothetical protein SASPL_133143 [Salvia splendens]|uniref:Uncharacterized protein n=1 Tax=Salvia splendens TaxID=180675 RepID=A0A8X8ZI55_SALSN|nr:hypothetical protein SASPL_133143 [Salvia splendens]
MSFSTLKQVSCCIPPAAGPNDPLSKVSRLTMINIQAQPPQSGWLMASGSILFSSDVILRLKHVKGKEKLLVRKSLSATSRREMMQLTAASVGLLSLVLPPSAEADTGNAIMEIFGELGRKIGLIKPKDEGKEEKPKDESEGKSKVQSGDTKEAKPKSKDEGEAKSKAHDSGKEAQAEINVEKEQPSTPQESKVAPSEGPVIPALPGIINGKAIETALP